jgi:PAS domain S-box-containing protein
MFGYSPGEMIGQLSRVHFANEETFVRMGKELYGTLRGGAPVHVQESELIRKDGSTFWARATAAALDRDDPLRGIIVMYEDITEQRAAAEALQRALERQRGIFDASPHGIATFEQRRFVLTSPALERMFGYAPGQMAGKLARIIYTRRPGVRRDRQGGVRIPACRRGGARSGTRVRAQGWVAVLGEGDLRRGSIATTRCEG